MSDTRWVVETVSGRAVPLRGDDIDTDRIIPARFLRCVTFEGLEAHAFEDDRAQLAGKHPFDDPRFLGASVLVAGRNFGCGSSREHAPQALQRWGIRGIVGVSFAEIFFGNCVALGVPCLALSPEEVARLQTEIESDPSREVSLDVRARRVRARSSGAKPFDAAASIPEGARESFLGGTWDAAGLLLRDPDAIRATARRLPYVGSFA